MYNQQKFVPLGGNKTSKGGTTPPNLPQNNPCLPPCSSNDTIIQ